MTLDGLIGTWCARVDKNPEHQIITSAHSIVQLDVDYLLAVHMRACFTKELDVDMPVLELVGVPPSRSLSKTPLMVWLQSSFLTWLKTARRKLKSRLRYPESSLLLLRKRMVRTIPQIVVQLSPTGSIRPPRSLRISQSVSPLSTSS